MLSLFLVHLKIALWGKNVLHLRIICQSKNIRDKFLYSEHSQYDRAGMKQIKIK